MTYAVNVCKAIVDLKSRKGCSRAALKGWFEANTDGCNAYALRTAINKLLDEGLIDTHEKYTGSFILTEEGRASLKPKKKKAAPKKKTTKAKKKTTKKKTTKKKATKKKSEAYYKTIKGVKYDKGLLEAADEAVAGTGDGRISAADAKKLFEEAADGNKYTAVEKKTIKYIRDNYKFTDSGDKALRKMIASWAAKKGAAKKKAGAPKKKKAAPKKKATKKKATKKKTTKKKASKKRK